MHARALWVALAAWLLSPHAQAQQACIRVRAEARYAALAYNHIVHLTNMCDAAQVCTVTTNVNPTPIEAAVPGHREVEVLTFRGSPAREFTPTVTCKP
jgi:hypothetical protein